MGEEVRNDLVALLGVMRFRLLLLELRHEFLQVLSTVFQRVVILLALIKVAFDFFVHLHFNLFVFFLILRLVLKDSV